MSRNRLFQPARALARPHCEARVQPPRRQTCAFCPNFPFTDVPLGRTPCTYCPFRVAAPSLFPEISVLVPLGALKSFARLRPPAWHIKRRPPLARSSARTLLTPGPSPLNFSPLLLSSQIPLGFLFHLISTRLDSPPFLGVYLSLVSGP